MNYEFNWSMLLEEPYIDWIKEGLLNTVQLSLMAWFIALTIGIVIGSIRMMKSPVLRLIGTFYVEILEIYLCLFNYLFGFVFPLLLPDDLMRAWNSLDGVPFLTALIGLSLFTAARVAEQIRSGITSIPKGQFNAAFSTGLIHFKLIVLL